MAAQTQPQPHVDSTKFDRSIGVCKLTENPPIPLGTAVNSFSPLIGAYRYFKYEEHKDLGFSGKVTVIQQPKYGVVEGNEEGNFRYSANSTDFVGNDEAAFLVEIGGYNVEVRYFFKVQFGGYGGTDGYDPYLDKKNCPQGRAWKISLNPDNPNLPI